MEIDIFYQLVAPPNEENIVEVVLGWVQHRTNRWIESIVDARLLDHYVHEGRFRRMASQLAQSPLQHIAAPAEHTSHLFNRGRGATGIAMIDSCMSKSHNTLISDWQLTIICNASYR